MLSAGSATRVQLPLSWDSSSLASGSDVAGRHPPQVVWPGRCQVRNALRCRRLNPTTATEERGTPYELGLLPTGGAAYPQLLSALHPSSEEWLHNKGSYDYSSLCEVVA